MKDFSKVGTDRMYFATLHKVWDVLDKDGCKGVYRPSSHKGRFLYPLVQALVRRSIQAGDAGLGEDEVDEILRNRLREYPELPEETITSICGILEEYWFADRDEAAATRKAKLDELCEKPAKYQTDWGWTS